MGCASRRNRSKWDMLCIEIGQKSFENRTKIIAKDFGKILE
jgi:hypothetical protein